MSVFTMADLHLSLNADTDKSMEVFGRRWQDYIAKIEHNWNAVVGKDDTVVLPGDISWALSPEEAVADFRFLDSLPGKKIIGKGNHDFWWQTMAKLRAYCESNGFTTFSFLYNNAFLVENTVVCGTRGWFADPDCDNIPENTDFAKISAREAMRLQRSLDEAHALQESNPGADLAVFLHFPAVFGDRVSDEIFDVLRKNEVPVCYFGHIHGSYDAPAEFTFGGVRFVLIAADYLNFVPKLVKK